MKFVTILGFLKALCRPDGLMDVSLLIELCGTLMFAGITVTSIIMTAAACWLAFFVRREHLLTTFLPLSAAPFLLALGGSLLDQVASVSAQINQTGNSLDSALQLQLQIIPVLYGLIASLPAAVVLATSRFWIGMHAVASQWSAERKAAQREKVSTEQPSAVPSSAVQPSIAQETEDYLERLVRPR